MSTLVGKVGEAYVPLLHGKRSLGAEQAETVQEGEDVTEALDVLEDGDSPEGESEPYLRGADIYGWLDETHKRFVVHGVTDRTFVRVMDEVDIERTLQAIREDEKLGTVDYEKWLQARDCGQGSHVLNVDKQLKLLDIAVIDRIESIKEDFPNFEEVIDWVIEALSLALMGPSPYAWMPPLVINGPPGIGKTAFMHRLARELGVHTAVIDCSQIAGSFELFGQNSSWKNAGQGRVAREMCDSPDANPILMLDEIDKGRGDERFPIQASLNQVFERGSATRFRDGFLEVPMDVSRVIWICASNDIKALEGYVLSRVKVIEATKPDAAQMRLVAQSVWKSLRNENLDTWGQMFSSRLSRSVVERIVAAGVTPRIIKRLLTQACARIARRVARQSGFPEVRYCVSASDIRLDGSDAISERRSIGFLC